MNPESEALRRALEDIVKRAQFKLPPYPAVALRLQRILARPNYQIHEVADAISADPALAARVLGTANSALYRATDDITTVARAANRLGARVLYSIAIAAGVGEGVTQPGLLFDVKYRVWRRSLTTALACQKLGPLRRLEADQAFLLGLLYGLGRAVAVASLEELVRTHQPPRPLTLSEWLAIAESQRHHLAEAVATSWGLPAALVQSLRALTSTPEGALLADAERIATALENGERPQAPAPNETRALEELIFGLPHALELLAQVPPPAPTRAAGPVASDPGLSGDRRPCSLPISDRKKQGVPSLRCVAITPAGLEFESPRPFQESSIVHLTLGTEPELAPWLNVLRSSEKDGRYRIEVALFSPTRELKERWQALFDQSV